MLDVLSSSQKSKNIDDDQRTKIWLKIMYRVKAKILRPLMKNFENYGTLPPPAF
jgi:hypothetical protein